MSVSQVKTVVREIADVAELECCEAIQKQVWGMSDAEVVPVAHLRASQHAGGLLAGAWLEGGQVGFSYGFPAHRPDRLAGPGLHSHMTAVVATARNQGVGRALKEFQRNWCQERGIGWVEWTFDPLRAANARFNLRHLGVTIAEYLPNAYGTMTDALNDGIPTDRLVALWQLQSQAAGQHGGEEAGVFGPSHSRIREDGRTLEPGIALEAATDGLPCKPDLHLTTPLVAVAIPHDISEMLLTAREAALSWRLAVREALTHYLYLGYQIEDFYDNRYLLYRPTGES